MGVFFLPFQSCILYFLFLVLLRCLHSSVHCWTEVVIVGISTFFLTCAWHSEGRESWYSLELLAVSDLLQFWSHCHPIIHPNPFSWDSTWLRFSDLDSLFNHPVFFSKTTASPPGWVHELCTLEEYLHWYKFLHLPFIHQPGGGIRQISLLIPWVVFILDRLLWPVWMPLCYLHLALGAIPSMPAPLGARWWDWFSLVSCTPYGEGHYLSQPQRSVYWGQDKSSIHSTWSMPKSGCLFPQLHNVPFPSSRSTAK